MVNCKLEQLDTTTSLKYEDIKNGILSSNEFKRLEQIICLLKTCPKKRDKF